MPTTSSRPPSRPSDAFDLPLTLSADPANQGRRVDLALREAILGGRLAAGSRLPSSRSLAAQLGVQRNAVVVAYESLQADGLVEGRTGAGTYVAARLPRPPDAAPSRPPRIALPRNGLVALGRTAIDPVLMRRLGRALRRQTLAGSADTLGYGDPRGSRELREALAGQLASSRGLHCHADQIIVTSGTQPALRLIAAALLRPGDRVGVEDPGYPVAHHTLRQAGLALEPMPIDAQGLDIERASATARRARAIYVTPSNQFPSGVTMTLQRRIALVEWARRHDAWIIEDDYDNEFRYEGPPLTALAGMSGDRVLYLGTFSKTLFAALRLAYVVLPMSIVERVVALRAAFDRFPPSLPERAVAELLADGSLRAHHRRMRSRYRHARDLLADALRRAAGPALTLVVPAQGLHLLACLPERAPASLAGRIRERAGLDVWLLSETRLRSQGPDGFVLGFAGHDDARIRQAADALGQTAREALGALP
ncbi:MAG: PLP-dependent aminotransferase family protein [Burkholderiaceae bacterium]